MHLQVSAYYLHRQIDKHLREQMQAVLESKLFLQKYDLINVRQTFLTKDYLAIGINAWWPVMEGNAPKIFW